MLDGQTTLESFANVTFWDVLARLRAVATSERQKGGMFERLCVFYLRNDPTLSQLVGEVWPWDEAPTNDGQDTGIDVVAEDPDNPGRYWAIQCKFYDSSSSLSLGECATFWATAATGSDSSPYARTMLFATTDKLTDNLRKAVADNGTVLVTPLTMADANVDWNAFLEGRPASRRVTYNPHRHQRDAIDAINKKFDEEGYDRAKAIEPCGTGKTLMSLRLAESRCPDGTVLFAAPSIALVSQALREWANQARVTLRALVVCSDSHAGDLMDDDSAYNPIDMGFPVTTDAARIAANARALRERCPDCMLVVFSTYQSMQAVSDAQALGLPAFDLAVCDEAHRTTGLRESSSGQGGSAFQLIHDQSCVHAAKRLYMTATERIYGPAAKASARQRGASRADDGSDDGSVVLYSMDDESVYGPRAHSLPFSKAVERGLLCDYRVVVLAVHEESLPESVRAGLKELESSGSASDLDLGVYAKVVGVYKALATHGADMDDPEDTLGGRLSIREDFGLANSADGDDDSDGLGGIDPLHRVVFFCGTISSSIVLRDSFDDIVHKCLPPEEAARLKVSVRHVDGTMNAKVRGDELVWLAGETEPDECRVLSNARCLSEGVDVPSLDAVVFFAPRRSEIDVVQAVGRVMRSFTNPVTGERKRLGYIILPVFVPEGQRPEDVLNGSETFDVVWSVLRALRSHDNRFEAIVNALSLRRRPSEGSSGGDGRKALDGLSDSGESGDAAGHPRNQNRILEIPPASAELTDAIYPQLVRKVGDRVYWDTWSADVARIASQHIERIEAAVRDSPDVRAGLDMLLGGLQESLNPSVTERDAVEMLAQHMITAPIFNALFDGLDFSRTNSVARSIDSLALLLEESGVTTDTADQARLDALYASVARRASHVRDDRGRQELVKNLYEEFFSKAFSKTADKLGIVYTPSEIVRFMLRFSDRVLYKEFGRHIADHGVHTLDPFAGACGFYCALLEDEQLMPLDKLEYKYEHELHSNEILLLAYYIMVANMECAYHARTGEWKPYVNAVLTDTFEMTERDMNHTWSLLPDNDEHVREQLETPITLVVGNPPWRSGQSNANDDAANEHYPLLEQRIRDTYAAQTSANNTRQMMDSYIKAFRWASDRILRNGNDSGVVAFVTNGSWLRSEMGAGIRRCFVDEFNSVYVVDLRGNSRVGDRAAARDEGGNVFDVRVGVTITVLVRNPSSSEHGVVRYFDVGKGLTKVEKLSRLASFLDHDPEWTVIRPDRHGDWLDQRDDSWYELAPMGIADGSKKTPDGLFATWSLGIASAKDPWIWNYSRQECEENISRLLDNINQVITETSGVITSKNYDKTKYAWTEDILQRAKRGPIEANLDYVVQGSYRPFCRQWGALDRSLIARYYQQEKLFPLKAPHETFENVIIEVPGRSNSGFCCLITDRIPDLNSMNAGAQCFPLYWYERVDDSDKLFAESHPGDKQVRDAWGNRYVRHDAITDHALQVFRDAYPTAFLRQAFETVDHSQVDLEGNVEVRKARRRVTVTREVTKEDVFYYAYGLLHSSAYRERYTANLARELPRLPLVSQDAFVAFVEAGRELAKLHLSYESVEPWPNLGYSVPLDASAGRVSKMKWRRRRDPETGKSVVDHTALVYNADLTISNIPKEAQRYVVNGKSALDWVIDRYQVSTDKATGITKDPNEYSDDPLYIVKLIGSLVTVSIRTLEIIESLPPIREIEKPASWPEAWKPKE